MDLKDKEAETPKEKDENVEIFVIRKSLEMLGSLLESSDIKSLNGTLLSLLDKLIIPAVQSVNFNTRKSAVKAVLHPGPGGRQAAAAPYRPDDRAGHCRCPAPSTSS